MTFRHGFRSLGGKLTFSVVLVLVLTTAAAANRIGREAHRHLIDAKARASLMVANLAAETLAPAVDFGDRDAAATALLHLNSNQEITYAGVWGSAPAPIAEWGVPRHPRGQAARDLDLSIGGDTLTVVRRLTDPSGNRIGVLVTEFSLLADNAQFSQTRRSIYAYAALLCVFLGAVVLAVMRWQVVRPLARLVAATQKVKGGAHVTVNLTSNDELGTLGHAFNVMSLAIAEREDRLASMNQELKQLLDNMRQAIVVFGREGRLAGFHSNQAELLFARRDLAGQDLSNLLYPDDPDGVEAVAFRNWRQLVFDGPAERWGEYVEFAPSQVTVHRGGELERVLQLDFIPITQGDRLLQVMLLATDVSDKSRLERKVRQQDEEHSKQLAAMRRLLAGGGQLLISLLQNSRDRVQRCHETIASGTIDLASVESMFRQIHTIKGEARAFDLKRLERTSAALEDQLSLMRTRLRSPDVEELTEDLSNVKQQLRDVEFAIEAAHIMLIEASPIGPAIVEQITVRRPDLEQVIALTSEHHGPLWKAVCRLAARPFGECLIYLGEAVPAWAQRYGKAVSLIVEGRDIPVPIGLSKVLPGVMTHLARNAVAHGIESVEARRSAGKPPQGTIRVAATESGEGLEIIFSDDGQGLNRAIIRELAAQQQLVGEAEELVFIDGFTTGEATVLSGHGVGLGAVREELALSGYEVELVPVDVGTKFRIFSKASAEPVVKEVEAGQWRQKEKYS